MDFKIILFLLQLSIFCYLYDFVNGKPLFGYNVRAVGQNEYLFVVGIIQINNQIPLEESIMCTGTLITYYHILTVAHCFDGIGNATFGIIAESNVLRHTTIHHPNWWISYDQWSTISNVRVQYSHDIAAIKLIQRVSQHVTPAHISMVQFQTLYGVDVTVVGWGDSNEGDAPEIMEKANLKIISNSVCSTIASNLQGCRVRIPSRYVCTRANPYIRISDGDSGGPLLYEGNIIAINKGVFPIGDESYPEAVNFHIGLNAYGHFITSILNT